MAVKIIYEDKDILAKIQNTVDDLNGHIASLSGIKEFEDKLTPEYQKFHDEGISVSIKSEIAVKGLYSNIIPYIKQDNDDNLYPTAGEGRKKLLAYPEKLWKPPIKSKPPLQNEEIECQIPK